MKPAATYDVTCPAPGCDAVLTIPLTMRTEWEDDGAITVVIDFPRAPIRDHVQQVHGPAGSTTPNQRESTA